MGHLGIEDLPGDLSEPRALSRSPQTSSPAPPRLASGWSRPGAEIPRPRVESSCAHLVTPGSSENPDPRADGTGRRDLSSRPRVETRVRAWTGVERGGTRAAATSSGYRPGGTSPSGCRSDPAHSPSLSPAPGSLGVLAVTPRPVQVRAKRIQDTCGRKGPVHTGASGNLRA